MSRMFLLVLLMPISACSTIEKNNCSYSLEAATYNTITEPVVMGSPISRKMTTIPAEYGTVIETIVIREATSVTVRIPAVYGVLNGKRVMVEPHRFE